MQQRKRTRRWKCYLSDSRRSESVLLSYIKSSREECIIQCAEGEIDLLLMRRSVEFRICKLIRLDGSGIRDSCAHKAHVLILSLARELSGSAIATGWVDRVTSKPELSGPERAHLSNQTDIERKIIDTEHANYHSGFVSNSTVARPSTNRVYRACAISSGTMKICNIWKFIAVYCVCILHFTSGTFYRLEMCWHI